MIGGLNDTNVYRNLIMSYKEINGKKATGPYAQLDAISSMSSLFIDSNKLYIFGGIGKNNNVSNAIQLCEINI